MVYWVMVDPIVLAVNFWQRVYMKTLEHEMLTNSMKEKNFSTWPVNVIRGVGRLINTAFTT